MNKFEKNILRTKSLLFRNGWVKIDSNLLGIKRKVSNEILKIQESEYVKNAKNQGVLSLPQNAIKKHSIFQEILGNNKIIEFSELITGRKLKLTTFMQMLTIGETKSLQWHRDSYCRKREEIGPIPQVFKIMLFNDSISPIDGPFQVISGSHVLDLNNRIFDKMIPFLRAYKLTSFTNKKNTCIIFDGRILHRRLFSSKGGRRSVTIISLESPN